MSSTSESPKRGPAAFSLKMLGIAIVTGVVAALVCTIILKGLDVNLSPAVLGGVAGGVSGSVITALVRIQRSGEGAPR